RRHNVFHVENLRPYEARDVHEFPNSEEAVPDLAPVNDDLPKRYYDGAYEVERILDHRSRDGSDEYLIKWAGYPLADSTWQTREDLADAQGLLQQYEDSIASGSNSQQTHRQLVDVVDLTISPTPSPTIKPKRQRRSPQPLTAVRKS
ncbi:hypothetical protein DFQ27_002961, partial [Actinomortierella ambigua]